MLCLRFDVVEGGASPLDFGDDVCGDGFQMKGLGSRFQCCAQVVIASDSSATYLQPELMHSGRE